MTKVGRTLSHINTSERKKASLEASTEKMKSSKSVFFNGVGGGGVEYLLKSVWNKAFEFRKDLNGNEYLFGKLPLVLQYGLTMYADNGADIPTLAEGLPFDQRTIWLNPETGLIEVIGGTGEEGVSNFWDLSGIPSWITSTKPIYNYSEINGTPDLSVFVTDTALNKTLSDYATLTYLTGELKKYVTLDGAQDIKGVKNFVNGLKIGGLPITKKQDDVVYLDANLVVRGGITMYAENEVDIPSILDSLPIASNTALGIASFDSTYFSVDSNGMVSLTSAPSSGASYLGELLNVDDSIDATASVDRVLYQPAGSAIWTWKELTSSGVVGDYLPITGGELYSSTTRNVLNIRTALSLGPVLNLMDVHGNTIASFGHIPKLEYTYSGSFWINNELNIGLILGSDGGVYISTNAGLLTRDFTVLHSANFSSYALPLAGGTMTGDLTFQNSNVNINSNRLLMSSENSYGKSSWRIYAYGTTVQFVETSNANWCLKLNNDNSINVNNIITSKGVNGRYSEFDSNGINCYGTTSGGYAVGVSLYDNNGTFKQTIINAFGDGSNFRYIFIGGEYNKPWIKIDASANMLVKGGITMYSDQRKKTILNHVELSLRQIADAPLIEHYYNSDQEKTTHVGSIAQYWAELNDWFCKLDNEGFYTMEIQNCALASAISIARHLEKYESKTDKKIRMLKKRVQELEDKLEKLEGGNYGCN